MNGYLQDLGYVVRGLAKSPGFTAIAVLTLALGIGSATAIFSVVESVLLRPLPYADSERIVALWEVDDQGRRMQVSTPNYLDWNAQARSFEVMASAVGQTATVITERGSRRTWVVGYRGDILRVYGRRVAAGRALTEEEIEAGSPLAIVPNDFAERVWGSAAASVGETIKLRGLIFTVVGVLEAILDERIDVFVPAAAFGPDDSHRTAHNWRVLARLRKDASLAVAQSEMQTIGSRLREEYGEETDATGVHVITLLDNTVGQVRPALLVLLAAGGMLILIACVNVANLLLGRSVSRQGETALRQALGAGRWRLVRQSLTESVVLAAVAGAAGIVAL